MPESPRTTTYRFVRVPWVSAKPRPVKCASMASAPENARTRLGLWPVASVKSASLPMKPGTCVSSSGNGPGSRKERRLEAPLSNSMPRKLFMSLPKQSFFGASAPDAQAKALAGWSMQPNTSHDESLVLYHLSSNSAYYTIFS